MVFVYNKSRAMITCCNDGTRPVIFKIERIEIDKWKIAIDGGSVNYEKDCMCNAMYSACI